MTSATRIIRLASGPTTALLAMLLCGCGAGTASDAGVDCGAPFAACGALCIDVASDAVNCGGCGKACQTQEVCGSGHCAKCPEPTSACGGQCLDLESDPMSCGACASACAPGDGCTSGHCDHACKPGESVCAGACNDFQSDPKSCGACGVSCGALTCLGGACHGCTLDFAPAVSYLKALVSDADVSDLDGDGALDLAAVIALTNVNVLRNDGHGVFGAPAEYATGPRPIALVSGDVDGDMQRDLVVAGGPDDLGPLPYGVLLNRGAGTFGAPIVALIGLNSSLRTTLSLVDLDGDGHRDFLWGSLYVPNQGQGRFGQFVSAVVNNAYVSTHDMDGDGKPDLIASPQPTSLAIAVLINEGKAKFGAVTTTTTTHIAIPSAIGDLNGDGRPDLVALTGVLAVLFGQLGGGLGGSVEYPINGVSGDPKGAAIADFNGDGRNDVALCIPGAGVVSVLLNVGKGVLASGIPAPAGGLPTKVIAADLDGDKKPDLVVVNQRISVLLNRSQCK